MKDKIVRKNILLAVTVIMCGLLIAGGTFAYLTATATVNNGTYNTGSTCFVIDYTAGDQMTGTLFPSPNASEGLTGSVSMKISSSCTTLGKGTLYLNIKNTTNTKFDDVVAAHCENPNTLETIPNAKTSSACSSSGGSWVTNGTALKYAIYDSNTYTGTPLAKGYIASGMIGSETAIYTNFDVTHTLKNYYIAIWLDGYVSDNTYVDLAFSGHIRASASQVENAVPSEYQQVEYIHFSGSQYINTGTSPSVYGGNYSVEIREKHAANSSNMYIIGTNTASSNNGSRSNIRIDANGVTARAYTNNSDNSSTVEMTASNKLVVNSINFIKHTANTTNGTRTFQVNDYVTNSSTAFISVSTVTWRIGGYNTSPSYIGDIYSVKIYGNGTLVRDFIPCKRISDNVPGLYDAVAGTFYTSSGSGSITAGPNV